MLTILDQTYASFEIIIIDDSPSSSAKNVVMSFRGKFELIGCNVKYQRGSGDGLPAARNLGISLCENDFFLFLDDDTLLDSDLLSNLAIFLRETPSALGVQPKIVPSVNALNKGLKEKLKKSFYKVMMLSYYDSNKLSVRRSGTNVLPDILTKTIFAQRLSGCCFCCKREVFGELSFDTNLKRWGFMEDLDFSYSVFKLHPNSLYAVPFSKVVHKDATVGRLSMKLRVYMETTYWSYIFFKDVFEGSVINLAAFFWALTGSIISVTGTLINKRKPTIEHWRLVYLIGSYFSILKHLREIKQRNLYFFNKQLNK
jgi:GT2 family glycosyltransferase